MERNEFTSKRVAEIAGRILEHLSDCTRKCDDAPVRHLRSSICTVGELKALAASALTQSADKPKRKRPTKRTIKRSK